MREIQSAFSVERGTLEYLQLCVDVQFLKQIFSSILKSLDSAIWYIYSLARNDACDNAFAWV